MKRLNQKHYKKPNTFVSDCLLTFGNAKKFNEEFTEVTYLLNP